MKRGKRPLVTRHHHQNTHVYVQPARKRATPDSQPFGSPPPHATPHTTTTTTPQNEPPPNKSPRSYTNQELIQETNRPSATTLNPPTSTTARPATPTLDDYVPSPARGWNRAGPGASPGVFCMSPGRPGPGRVLVSAAPGRPRAGPGACFSRTRRGAGCTRRGNRA